MKKSIYKTVLTSLNNLRLYYPLKTHILSSHIRLKKSHYFHLIYGDKHRVGTYTITFYQGV